MDDEIQRVLFLGKVHCYGIPPLGASSGYKASDWGIENPKSVIFTARIRVIETSSSSSVEKPENSSSGSVRTDIRLEDPSTGELFANGPYEGPYCVTPVTDSSRFFALRVMDGGRKAYLGIGFEERSDAFDFGVCLQEVNRQNAGADGNKAGGAGGGARGGGPAKKVEPEPKKDYSLKEGETINVTIGSKGRRRPQSTQFSPGKPADGGGGGGGSPGGVPGALPFLPPPPSADEVKRKRQSGNPTFFEGIPSSNGNNHARTSSSGGFDDDPFGDFV